MAAAHGCSDEDLIGRLPGQPRVHFRQYGGYVTVDKKAGRSLFYYFVEAQHRPHQRPSTLWLNGGPGCSSIGGGGFTELGPFFPRGDGRSLQRNPKSWNKGAQFVPIRQKCSLDVTHWYCKFDFLIGNPLLNLAVDTAATYEYFWSHGLISEETGSAINKECDFRKYTNSGDNLSPPCRKAISDAEEEVGDYINEYDVILDVCYPSIVEQELRLRKWVSKISIGVDVCMTYERHFYFNIPEVQHALHANRTNLPYTWSMCSGFLNYTESDISIDILPVLKTIIRHGIPVWIFSGDQDSVVPLLGSRSLTLKLAGELGFNTTVPYGAWFYEGQVGGWATEYGNLLTFATVRGASHMVPFSHPGRALALFKSFLANRRLPNSTTVPID